MIILYRDRAGIWERDRVEPGKRFKKLFLNTLKNKQQQQKKKSEENIKGR